MQPPSRLFFVLIGYLHETQYLVEKIRKPGKLIAQMDAKSGRRLFRFGAFEADEHTGELRKQGRRLLLQGQPLQVLLLLLERAGELVSRAEIQQRLWPDGTFVDFDHGLNTAINKIREALGDSASSPRFVETLARRGYRFIAPVDVVEADSARPQAASAPPSAPAESTQTKSQPSAAPRSEVAPVPALQSSDAEPLKAATGRTRTLLATPEELPQASRRLVRTLFLLLQVMYLGFYAVSLARLRIVETIVPGESTHAYWVLVLLIVTAAVGIPTRLYLLSAVAFGAPGLRERFLRIFPVIFPLDELWALAPFLLAPWIGFGAALASTAALLYAPFAQRSLILMGAGSAAREQKQTGTNE